MTAASAAPARVVVPSSAGPRGGAVRRGAALGARAAEATQKAKPDWAGDDVLSKVVDAAINNKVLYEGLMKPMARRTLINTAEKNGVAWRDIAARLEKDPSIQKRFDDVKNDAVEYPEYYLKPFHAYAEGNLCWLAAFEAEPATYSMALRGSPKDRITAEVAQARLRGFRCSGLRLLFLRSPHPRPQIKRRRVELRLVVPSQVLQGLLEGRPLVDLVFVEPSQVVDLGRRVLHLFLLFLIHLSKHLHDFFMSINNGQGYFNVPRQAF